VQPRTFIVSPHSLQRIVFPASLSGTLIVLPHSQSTAIGMELLPFRTQGAAQMNKPELIPTAYPTQFDLATHRP
jgi:hypothetical protein